jgi:hypothetical protein
VADHLIPHLRELPTYQLIRVSPSVRDALGEQVQPWSISVDFIRRWLATHDENENLAQDHWEQLIENIGESDAVEKHVTGAKAVRQAVTAGVIFLQHPGVSFSCSYCPRREKPDQPINMEDAEEQTAREGSTS